MIVYTLSLEHKYTSCQAVTAFPAGNYDSADKGTPQEKPKDGSTPGKKTSDGPGAKGSGTPTDGGKPGEQPNADTPLEAIDTLAEKASSVVRRFG